VVDPEAILIRHELPNDANGVRVVMKSHSANLTKRIRSTACARTTFSKVRLRALTTPCQTLALLQQRTIVPT